MFFLYFRRFFGLGSPEFQAAGNCWIGFLRGNSRFGQLRALWQARAFAKMDRCLIRLDGGMGVLGPVACMPLRLSAERWLLTATCHSDSVPGLFTTHCVTWSREPPIKCKDKDDSAERTVHEQNGEPVVAKRPLAHLGDYTSCPMEVCIEFSSK